MASKIIVTVRFDDDTGVVLNRGRVAPLVAGLFVSDDYPVKSVRVHAENPNQQGPPYDENDNPIDAVWPD